MAFRIHELLHMGFKDRGLWNNGHIRGKIEQQVNETRLLRLICQLLYQSTFALDHGDRSCLGIGSYNIANWF